jgi:uncharacterized membrane protein
MLSKARIGDHPIHPMVVALPIGMFVATVGALLAFMNGGDPFYYRAAMVANVAGVAAALIAAVPGAIDLVSLPAGSDARRTGIKHAGSALVAVGLFSVSAGLLWRGWSALAEGEVLAAAIPLAVAVAGLLVLVIVGTLGWSLVQTHHVGVKPSFRSPVALSHSFRH